MDEEEAQPFRRPPTVLLVEADTGDRELLGSWLEDEGFGVLACPGPRAPGYVCVGGREGTCPLIEPAEVVILDLRLPGEDTIEGTSASELLALYTSSGKPVVAIGPDSRRAQVFAPAVVVGAWPPDRRSLVKTVRELAGPRAV
jgi:CheY-like chemotaxis protein